jgi:dihydroorotate dehydrogenase
LYRPRKKIPINCFGQTYQHPFGNAAGLDKRAEVLRGLEAIGVSFIEIGGVTEHEQVGNPKPRMFRATASRSLVNRMGFNNPGSLKVALKLKQHFARFGSPSVPLWANLGKSKITSLEDAPNDYAQTMDRLWEYCDVFVINVSSPNTPNLRELQHDSALESIIESCHLVNQKNADSTQSKVKPILVKISPDLSDEQLVAIVKTSRGAGCDGIIATNTTIERPVSSLDSEQKTFAQTGGLSGSPLNKRSTDMIHQIYSLTNGEWPIIGVGGILSAEDAWAKIGAGACLLQAYSGFVFEGAGLTKSIVHGLDKKLKEHGYSTLQEAVGFSHRMTT